MHANRKQSGKQTRRGGSAERLLGSKFLRCHRQQREADVHNGKAACWAPPVTARLTPRRGMEVVSELGLKVV